MEIFHQLVNGSSTQEQNENCSCLKEPIHFCVFVYLIIGTLLSIIIYFTADKIVTLTWVIFFIITSIVSILLTPGCRRFFSTNITCPNN